MVRPVDCAAIFPAGCSLLISAAWASKTVQRRTADCKPSHGGSRGIQWGDGKWGCDGLPAQEGEEAVRPLVLQWRTHNTSPCVMVRTFAAGVAWLGRRAARAYP